MGRFKKPKYYKTELPFLSLKRSLTVSDLKMAAIGKFTSQLFGKLSQIEYFWDYQSL